MRYNMLHKIESPRGEYLGKVGRYGATAETPEQAFAQVIAERERIRMGPMFRDFPVRIETTLTWIEDE